VREGLRSRLERMRRRRSGAFADHTRGDYQHRAQREGHPVQRFWHAHKWPLVEAELDLGPGDRVLDVGAGSSEVPLALAERCRLACALDASPAPLHFLREIAGGQPRLHLAAGDLRALPFREASFDRIAVLEVVEHVPPDAVAGYLGELRRLLAPGGRLLLTTPNYRSLWPVLEFLIDHLGGAAQMGGAQHIARFHPRRLRSALETNGFRVLRSGSVYHLSPFLSPLAPALAERLFAWEARRGGRLGPILFAVAEPAGTTSPA
jgi:SAM-dependent methyltransferase